MSIRALSAVLDRYPRGGSEKLVLVTLADWCDDQGGNLYPSIQAVADKACVSRSQAQRILHALIADGMLAVVGNEAGGAPGSTRRYRLNVEAIERMPVLGRAETGSAHATHSADATGRTNATRTGSTNATGRADATGSAHAQDGSHPCTGGVAPVHKTGSTHATQSVSEPSVNHQGTIRDTRTTRRSRELSLLTGRGVDPKHAVDWLTIRGKHALTDTALAGIEREAAAAGITLAEAVRIAAERGWRGFSAAWLADKSARPTTDRSRAVADANAAMVARLSGQTIEGEVIHDPQ